VKDIGMSEEEEDKQEEDVEQLESIRSVSEARSGSSVSRVIEYPPTGGDAAIPRDCVFGGQRYSKGATIAGVDGNNYECTGDKDGSWKKKA
jgi:hypothetical protein